MGHSDIGRKPPCGSVPRDAARDRGVGRRAGRLAGLRRVGTPGATCPSGHAAPKSDYQGEIEMDLRTDHMTQNASDDFRHPLPPREDTEEEGRLVTLREVERRYIERVLREVRGTQRRAAKILGISRWSLARRLRKYSLAG